MGEFRLSASGYLAHEIRVLQDNMRIFDPSQAEPVLFFFFYFIFATSRDSCTSKRLEEGHFGFWHFISFSGPLQFLSCILGGTL